MPFEPATSRQELPWRKRIRKVADKVMVTNLRAGSLFDAARTQTLDDLLHAIVDPETNEMFADVAIEGRCKPLRAPTRAGLFRYVFLAHGLNWLHRPETEAILTEVVGRLGELEADLDELARVLGGTITGPVTDRQMLTQPWVINPGEIADHILDHAQLYRQHHDCLSLGLTGTGTLPEDYVPVRGPMADLLDEIDFEDDDEPDFAGPDADDDGEDEEQGERDPVASGWSARRNSRQELDDLAADIRSILSGPPVLPWTSESLTTLRQALALAEDF